MAVWPKAIVTWQTRGVGYMSVPFTWLLPEARRRLTQRDLFARRWRVGGPAVVLMPDYLAGIDGVTVGGDLRGVLQRVNPLATRTTVGCPNSCPFCAIGRGKIEGGEFRELADWPDLPIVCDNNLTSASPEHFERVIGKLRRWPNPDFNQGLDARLIEPWHAELLATLDRPIVRLALDGDGEREQWSVAVDRLLSAGLAKRFIRSYVMCGYLDTPPEAWARCEFVESHGVKALPQWFHRLDELVGNAITEDQRGLGWTRDGRNRIMGWYYQHRGINPAREAR